LFQVAGCIFATAHIGYAVVNFLYNAAMQKAFAFLCDDILDQSLAGCEIIGYFFRFKTQAALGKFGGADIISQRVLHSVGMYGVIFETNSNNGCFQLNVLVFDAGIAVHPGHFLFHVHA